MVARRLCKIVGPAGRSMRFAKEKHEPRARPLSTVFTAEARILARLGVADADRCARNDWRKGGKGKIGRGGSLSAWNGKLPERWFGGPLAMFGIHNYPEFILAIVVFQIMPGPGTLTILNATACHGVRAGFGAVLGTLTGDFLYMLSAVLGVAALLAAHPVWLTALQWSGIGYLAWLGLKLLFEPERGGSGAPFATGQGWPWFRQAFAVCLTNPKAIFFFMTFFPLFLGPDSPGMALGAMMAHVTLISLAYQSVLVLAGHAVASRLARHRGAQLAFKRLAGLGLLGFGLKLALRRS